MKIFIFNIWNFKNKVFKIIVYYILLDSRILILRIHGDIRICLDTAYY